MQFTLAFLQSSRFQDTKLIFFYMYVRVDLFDAKERKGMKKREKSPDAFTEIRIIIG